MAIAFLNIATGCSQVNNTTVASGAQNHTPENLLVVVAAHGVGNNIATITGVTDTAGNTYTFVAGTPGGSNTPGDDGRCEIWYAKNIIGNANNIITVTFSANLPRKMVAVLQYSGCSVSVPLDVSNTGRSNSTDMSTDAVAINYPNEVIVAGYCSINPGSFTPNLTNWESITVSNEPSGDWESIIVTTGAGFIVRCDFLCGLPGIVVEDRIVSEMGSYGSTMTQRNLTQWSGVHATFSV